MTFTALLRSLVLIIPFLLKFPVAAASLPDEIRIDFATYNPVSLVLKEHGYLESAFKAEGIKIRWVQSLGSNKALEFLNGESLDFGSTAGAAALLGRVGGNPIRLIYVTSKPEWTALVTAKGSKIQTVRDLSGKRVAVTRGTDPYIFLLRSLQEFGMSEKDVKLVLLQHQDGRTALIQGDVDAWAGLDPMMAQAEIEEGAKLFYRNVGFNSYGVLNCREAFIKDHPELVTRVIAAYEEARLWALAHPTELKKILAKVARISDDVAARQLERTDLTNPVVGDTQQTVISAAGLALQKAGLIAESEDVAKITQSLLDRDFTSGIARK